MGFLPDSGLQLKERESGGQILQYFPGNIIHSFHIDKFHLKNIFVIGLVFNDLGSFHKLADRVKTEVVFFIENAASEFDRGYVPFSGGAETQDEAQAFFLEMTLVRMHNNRRVKKSGRLDRILMSKKSPEQTPPLI